jgi:hypothetical protein
MYFVRLAKIVLIHVIWGLTLQSFVITYDDVFFLLGDSPAAECYVPTFHLVHMTYEDGTDSVLKHWHIKFNTGESRKRNNTTFTIQWEFELKNIWCVTFDPSVDRVLRHAYKFYGCGTNILVIKTCWVQVNKINCTVCYWLIPYWIYPVLNSMFL